MRDRLHDRHQIAGAVLQLGDEHALSFDLLSGFRDILDNPKSAYHVATLTAKPAVRSQPADLAVGQHDAKLVDEIPPSACCFYYHRICRFAILGVYSRQPCRATGLYLSDPITEQGIKFVAPNGRAGSHVAIK